MAEPPAKRPRSDQADDEAHNPSATTYERGDHWFEDGNVVLVTQSTAFRVHRGVLTKHSDVFKDMFTVPQPANVEMMEGCPVVHLTDTKEDLGRLLTLLFGLPYSSIGFQRRPRFILVSTMLRLGTKYQIEVLRTDALRRLQNVFPSKLEKFRNSYTVEYDEELDGHSSESDTFFTQAINMQTEDAITVVNLARMFDLPGLLPGAFYCCSQLCRKTIMGGYLDEDKTLHKLSQEDALRIWLAETEMRVADAKTEMFIIKAEPSPECLTRQACTAVLSQHRELRSLWIQASPDILPDVSLQDSTSGNLGESGRDVSSQCPHASRGILKPT
ncbi:hypothetical protein EIP91_010009 [Steccherinum ochraceum]|uniref:BTB domain-containing protein n=1 Tax=Steccherinum ochraceum TaxID=92696 RepID=A0A4R0RR61_9APHY|nr:hypothetical protein EIP91_010009 [Steccherinum ochraceum]